MLEAITAFDSTGHQGTAGRYVENVSFYMLGRSYTNGARFVSTNYGSQAELQTEATGAEGITGDASGVFQIILDGELHETFNVRRHMQTINININVTNVNIIEFRLETDYGAGTSVFGLGNVMII